MTLQGSNMILIALGTPVAFIVCLLMVFVCLTCTRPRLRNKIFGKRMVKRSFNVRPLPSLPGDHGNPGVEGKDKNQSSLEDPALLGANGLFRTLSNKRYTSGKKRKVTKRSLLGRQSHVSRKTERRKNARDTLKNKDLNKKQSSRKTKRLKRSEDETRLEKIPNDKVDLKRVNSTNVKYNTHKPTTAERKKDDDDEIPKCHSFSGACGEGENDVLRLAQSAPYLTILDEAVIPNVSSSSYDVAETAYDHSIFRREGSQMQAIFPMPRGASLLKDAKGRSCEMMDPVNCDLYTGLD